MTRLWSIYALARADVLERTRRYQYLATIVVTLIVGTLLVPARNAGYETFLIDGYRGVYNSAWIGATFSIIGAMLLSLFGFYNVKSAVERDRQSNVGQIIASTEAGRFDYALGKAVSNFAVLASMAAILFAVAVAMQFVRGESFTLDLNQVITPMALIVFPTIAVISAVALLFEMVPWLRGSLGNVIFFFGWIGCLVWSFYDALGRVPWWRDLMGGNMVVRQIWPSLTLVDPRAKPGSIELGAGGETARRFFTFHGFAFTAGDVFERLVWFAIALLIVGAAALLFDRFANPARSSERRRHNEFASRCSAVWQRATTPLLDVAFGSDFGGIVLAELRLLLRGSSFWWYAVAAGLCVAQLFVDPKGQSLVVGLAWMWPLLGWSQLGTRETVNATEQFIYPTLHPIRRQFAAQWVAGVLLALATAGGSLIHWAATGNAGGIEGIAAGAIFVPTLALALGALSGTTRLFEAIYLLLWYIGPMNRTPLDFTQGAYAPGFFTASAMLLAAAVIARKARLALA